MGSKRETEILNSINACKRTRFERGEELTELLQLQQEMVDIAFSGFEGWKDDLRITDAAEMFCRQNESKHVVDDEMIQRFRKQAKRLDRRIKGEIAGLNGEKRIARELEKLACPKVILTNLELGEGSDHTEIDSLIIVPGHIFIAEIKNTYTDIFIADNGDYYKNGEFLVKKYNVSKMLEQREALVKEILNDNRIEGYALHRILVFANDTITVQNKCRDFSHCFWTTLPSIIESHVTGEFSEDEPEKIRDVFVSSEKKESYPLDFDAEQFKRDFARIIALLEENMSFTTTVKRQEEEQSAKDQPGQAKSAGSLKKVAAAIGFVLFPPAALLLFDHDVKDFLLE